MLVSTYIMPGSIVLPNLVPHLVAGLCVLEYAGICLYDSVFFCLPNVPAVLLHYTW